MPKRAELQSEWEQGPLRRCARRGFLYGCVHLDVGNLPPQNLLSLSQELGCAVPQSLRLKVTFCTTITALTCHTPSKSTSCRQCRCRMPVNIRTGTFVVALGDCGEHSCESPIACNMTRYGHAVYSRRGRIQNIGTMHQNVLQTA
jgi:hypothetical protein